MGAVLLSRLLQDIEDVSPKIDLHITGLALDSRQVQPGDLFFACHGTHTDGRKFINQAVEKGAIAIVAEGDTIPLEASVPVFFVSNLKHQISEIAARFYHHPGNHLEIVGVTGTNGKTSCSHFIAALLKHAGKSCGVMGTLGNGLYGNIQTSALTTPDPIAVQKNLAAFLAAGAKYVAMEVSSHSLDQGRVQSVPFKIGIFTNLTQDHLDYHGTMEAYGLAKAKLFNYPALQYAVINIDDPFGLELARKIDSSKSVYTYSTSPLHDSTPLVWAKDIQMTSRGIQATVKTPWGEGELHTGLIGKFNISNLLAALTALCLLEIPLPKVLESIANLQSVPGRMQTSGGGNKPLVVVDYSHTPDALEKALMALRLHCQGKLYCVFGCGGDRDSLKRPIMAKIAEKQADVIILTDDNPRTEDPKRITNDILKGFSNPDSIILQHDRSKAIRDAIQYAKPGDCVLIAGKGAETYQQVGEEKIPFSDIEQVSIHLR